MGIIGWAAVAALAAAPGSFSFDGAGAEARTTSSRAFVATGADPTVESYADARGEALLQVRERIDVQAATYGDEGSFEAELRVGLETWRITLEAAGAPPQLAGGEETGRTLPFAAPIAGGVRMAPLVLGGTGIGPRGAPARAAVALFGRARIERNGQLIAERAPAQVLALATGVHADDSTHRRLPSARAQDLELVIYVPALDSGLLERPYLYAVFEDVEVTVGGRPLPAQTTVAVTGAAPLAGPPAVAELEDVPALSPPAFEGFAQAGPAQAGLPVSPSLAPQTPQPLNAAAATPLPDRPLVLRSGTGSLASGASPTGPATPRPDTPQPLNASPGAATGSVPAVPPANAQPAAPLLPAPQPLNAAP